MQRNDPQHSQIQIFTVIQLPGIVHTSISSHNSNFLSLHIEEATERITHVIIQDYAHTLEPLSGPCPHLVRHLGARVLDVAAVRRVLGHIAAQGTRLRAARLALLHCGATAAQLTRPLLPMHRMPSSPAQACKRTAKIRELALCTAKFHMYESDTRTKQLRPKKVTKKSDKIKV